jgi:hypothetical protein
MNERIEELWDKAGGHYNRGNQHTWPEYTIDNPEKFAELIVKECIKVLDTNNAGLTLDAKWDAIYEIEQYFGVDK